MDFAEKAAKAALEAILPGARLIYRSRQSNGEYDFDLHYPDGRLAAVEVTISVDQRQMQTAAAIHSRKRSRVIPASKCKETWVVTPTPNANINAIRGTADTRLAMLEEAGVSEFSALEVSESKQIKAAGLISVLGDRVVPQCVESLCDDLMLQAGGVISSDGPPEIILGFPIYHGTVGPDRAIDAGKAEAWKEDNRKKLGAAAAGERHLAVLIHVTNGLAWTALSDTDPPATLPELPPEIDHIWLLGDVGRGAASRLVVWSASRTIHWNKLVVDLPIAVSPIRPAPPRP